MKHASFLSLNT